MKEIVDRMDYDLSCRECHGNAFPFWALNEFGPCFLVAFLGCELSVRFGVDNPEHLTVESVVKMKGVVQRNPVVSLNGIVIIPPSILESFAAPLPLMKDSSVDARMDYHWLDLRGEREQLLFRVQTCLTESMRQFLLKQGFLDIHEPKLIAMASESGSDALEVKYFDGKAYLAQSLQFYK